ncbi:MAG: alpha/beta hydrolase-fold protein [Bacteroidales bacterium]|nr:alpha/beta hydrolase-fold protein [Bacteroidales bacterium]MDD4217161.1 alpha/beta hydrolase-fold protein [Bacteroidales bacterium]
MKTGNLNSFIFILILIVGVSCNSNTNKKFIDDSDDSTKDPVIAIQRMNDTIVYYKYDCCFVVSTEIKYPSSETEIIGSILLLHGWNLPADEWCNKTSFCEKALNKGYVLIIPDYKKSNYCLEMYPQTIADYQKYPTITWMMEAQIPNFQVTFGLLLPGQNNNVAGISTGGRGATLMAYYMPEIFNNAASLSGDFDITKMQNEYLYYSFIGHYNDFPERWKKECFAYDCKNYKVPTYIGHGQLDNVSPVTQSQMMFDSIKSYHPNLKIIGHFPEYAAHNYDYWESETDAVLRFFDCCE